MKTTKYILSILCSTILMASGTAQVTYRDLSPDQVFEMPAETYNTFLFDFDNDRVDDFKLNYYNYPGAYVNLGIKQIEENNPTFEVYYDESKIVSPSGGNYIKQLNMNDAISPSSPFSSEYPQFGDVYDPNFYQAGEKYLGFRVKTGPNDYKYGWILLDFDGATDISLTIKELAYQNTKNTPIKAGEVSTVGISHHNFEQKGYSVIMDQYSNNLTVKNTQNTIPSRIQIYSITGKVVMDINNPRLTNEINTSSMGSGVFVLSIIDETGQYSKTFVNR